MLSTKQKAYELLLDYGISKVLQFSDIEKICSEKGWLLLPYKGNEDMIRRIGMEEMLSYDGFTYITKQGTHSLVIIFFRDTLGQATRIHVVSHEIGHIMLNHIYDSAAAFSLVEAPHEQEAEEFAFELELPSCISKRARLDVPAKFRQYGDFVQTSIAYHISENSEQYPAIPDNETEIIKQYAGFIKKCLRKAKRKVYLAVLFSLLVFGGCLVSLITAFLSKKEEIATPSPSPVSTSHVQSLDLDYGDFSMTVWPMVSVGWEMVIKDTPDEWLGEYAGFKDMLDDRRLFYQFNAELAKNNQGEYVDGYFIDQRNEGLTLDFVSLSDNEIQDILKKEMPDDLFYKTIPNLYQKWALLELQSSDPTWQQMMAITYMDGVCISYIYACDTELYSVERAENALTDAISRTSVKIK